ncbi:MAG: LacI family transcriptional regulator, partial [Chloroflexi bacterium]
MASIKDIANRAGVSTTTVSHVLNKSRPVHPDTVTRVMQAINDLHYQPNMLARSLRRRTTNTIGLLVSDVENPFFSELARSVEATAYQRGYNMIFCNTDENLEKEILYVDVLFAKQVDGLILSPVAGDHSYLNRYLENDARMVFVNRHIPGFHCPSVVTDDEEAMYQLASQLLASGHRRLAAIIGLASVSTTASRINGLRRALATVGLTLDDVQLIQGHSRREGGYQAARSVIAMPHQPTAVISFNSIMLDGFLLGLLDLAPHLIPRIEITGFGYSLVARACQPSKRYIRQPSGEVGATATNLLLDVLENKRAWSDEQIVTANAIVERG